MAIDPFQQSNELLTGAGDIMTNIGETSVLQNINDYINPYTQNVLDNTLARMDDTYRQNFNQIGDMASAGGAFGGARHVLLESDLMSNYQRNVGDVTSQIMSNAYSSGINTAFQDRNQQLGAAGGMQGLGQSMFGIGSNILDRQAGVGGQQQALMNAILQAGQNQFNRQMQSPYQMIDILNSILGADPRRGAGTATQQSTPGLFDYLALAAGVAGSEL